MINKKKLYIFIILFGLVFGDKLQISSFRIFGFIPTVYRVTTILGFLIYLYGLYKYKYEDDIDTEQRFLKYFVVAWFVYSFFRFELSNLKDFVSVTLVMMNFIIIQDYARKKEDRDTVINYLSIFTIFIVLFGCFEIMSGIHFGESRLNGVITPFISVGQFYNENDLSAFLAIMLPVIFLSKFSLSVKRTCFVLILLIIIMNKSIIVLFSILLCGFVYLFVKLLHLKNWKYKKTSIIGIMITTVLFIAKGSALIGETSFIYRLHMYYYGLKNCFSHFWFGAGIGNYEKGMISVGYEPLKYSSANPHSLFLEIWGEFGFIIFIIFTGYLTIKFFKRLMSFYKSAAVLDWILLCMPILYFFSVFSSSSCLEKSYTWIGLLMMSWVNTTFFLSDA